MIDCLEINKTLKQLNLSRNKITDEGTRSLAKALRVNTTLQTLSISKNWISKEGVMKILEGCAKNCALHKLVCTHNNLSKSGFEAINGYIRKTKAVQIFDASWNSIETEANNHEVTVITTFHLTDLKQGVQLDTVYNTRKESWCVDKITKLYKAQVLQCCFEEYLNKQRVNLHMNKLEIEILSECLKLNNTVTDLNLSGCLSGSYNITMFLMILSCLKINNTLHELNFSKNNINDTIVEALGEAIANNTTLQKLSLSHNVISDHGVFFIYRCLEVNITLCELDMSENDLTNKGAKILAEAIQVNTGLQELNISKNWISKEGIMRILEACTINKRLHKLVCTHNILSKSGLADIIEYNRIENVVTLFDTSWNSIGIKCGRLGIIITFHVQQHDVKDSLCDLDNTQKSFLFADEIKEKYRREHLSCGFESEYIVNIQGIWMSEIEILCDCLKINNTLTEINLSNNNITDEGVESLAAAIKVNKTLQCLNISSNTIWSNGILALSICLKVNKALHKLNISDNYMNDCGAKYLAEAIQINLTLQELNVSRNLISKEGAMKIVEACKINKTLHKLVCTHNNLSKPGLTTINEYIRKENAVQIFESSWNSIGSKLGKPAIIITFQSIDLNQNNKHCNINTDQEELWYVDEIKKVECRKDFLQCCFESEESVNFRDIRLPDYFEIEIISNSLKMNSTLSELILSNVKITDKEVIELSEAIEINATLQHLDISHNTISDHGISAICDCLVNNIVLCKVNLSKNQITDEGAKTLAEAIQENTNLHELDICKNLISKEGLMRVVEACAENCTLQKLHCTHNNISKAGLATINTFIITENAVQVFCASWNSIGTKNNKLAIKTNFQLMDINQKTQLGNEEGFELWCLDEITELEYRKKFLYCCFEEYSNVEIKLEHAKMTDTEVEILSDCLQINSTLTELSLSNCFTDDIVKIAISNISKYLKNDTTTYLYELNLPNNQITDNDLNTLAEAITINKSLQVLDISHNIISDSGISFISECLKVNKILHKLILFGNCITDEGAKSLAGAIQVNMTLKELNISKNCISKEGIMKIAKACTKQRTLHKVVCTYNNLSKSGLIDIIEYIRKEDAVQVFDASWNSICTKNGRLNIKTTLHGDQELQTDDDDIHYYINANIPAYSGRWNVILHCCFEEYLKEQSVNLQDVKMNDVEVKVLSNCLKLNEVLTELNISNYNENSKPNLDNILAISHCLEINRKLLKLNLSRNCITDEGAENLAEAIKVNSTLLELDLSKNYITKEGALKIIEGCTKFKTLHKLVLTHNWLLKSDLMAINAYIKKEKGIQVFEASWSSISSENGRLAVVATLHTLQLDDDGIYKELCNVSESMYDFANCCAEYSAMQSVSLQDITAKNFDIFYFTGCINFLMSTRGTTELPLSNCISKTPNFILYAMCEGLKNGTLCKLNLSNNHITDKRVQILLTEAVTINKTLKILELPHNAISDDGISRLTEFLIYNKTLHELNLSGNNITDQGAKKLSEAVQVNKTLQELNVSKNWISKEGVMKIVEACTINETLHKLICTHNNLTKSGLASIIDYVRENTTIQMFEGSWNSIFTTKHKLAIETTIQPLLQSEYDNAHKELWYVDEIAELNYRTQFLYCCFEEHMKEHDTDLHDIGMNSFEVEILDVLDNIWNVMISQFKINNTCIELNLSSCVMINHWLTCNVTSINLSTILKKLDLSCATSNDGVLFISSCLKTNDTLCELNLSGNDITDEGAKILAEAIQMNTVLQQLDISKNWISKEGIMRIVEACTINRALQKLVCRHNNLVKCGLAAINEYIRKEKAIQVFSASWNSIYTDVKNKLAIKTTFQLLDGDYSQCETNVQHDHWYEHNELKYIKEILNCCFPEYLNEKTVSLQSIQINDYEIELLCDCLKRNKILVELNLSDLSVSNNYYDCHPKFKVIKNLGDCLKINDTLCILKFSGNHITDDEVEILMEAVTMNVVLQSLDLSHNVITDHGILSLNNCLKVNKTLHELNLSRNNITDIGAKKLAESIQENTALLELNVSKNWISKEGVMKLVEACTRNRMLCTLVCTHNNLSKSELAEVIEYITKENAIQVFHGSWNSIGTKLRKLAVITTLQTLNVNQSNVQSEDNIDILQDIWYINEITKLGSRRKFLCRCLESEQSVNIQGIGMAEYFEIELMCDCLRINKTLTGLTLSKIKFTDNEVEKLAKVLKINATLQSVDISHNIITDNGMFMIINCLRNNRVLSKLNVAKNNMNDEGASRLAEAIQVNKGLQELNISKNFISKEGVMKIVEACTKRKTPLQKLVCTHNNLSKFGLAAINDYIREENALPIFNASWNSIGTKYHTLVIITTYCLLDGKQDLHHDTHKELWCMNEIPKEYRREFLFCCFNSDQSINLQGIRMTDYNEIELISDYLNINNTLIELNLSNCSIDDKGVEKIAEAIYENPRLQNLNISCNMIYSDGIKALSRSLKTNKTLRKLNISENIMGDQGAKYLAETIQVNETLLELDISKNEISEKGVMNILEASTNHRTLHKILCTHNKLIESEVVDINEYIKTNNAVNIFDTSWNNIIAKYVSKMDEQRYYLIIIKFQSSTWLLDGNFETKCSKNNELWLVDDYYRKWHNSNMQYNFLHGALTELKFIPSMKSCLILHHCVQAIMKISTLKKLDISGNKISDDGAIRLSKCLSTEGTLTELGLSENKISCKGVSAIAKAMMNTTIQKLDVSNNEISNDCTVALSKCLKTNTTLIDLDVSNNSISCKGVSAIAEALQVNSTTLQKLDISNCIAGDDGAIAFSKCLKTNTKLIELKLSGNEITSNGISAIVEAMQENNALQKLDISNNKISDNGMLVFSKYLEKNLSLVELNISGNGITCQGACAIAKAMHMNTTLRKLDISNNEILDNGVKAFSKYLNTNPPLTELRMSQIGITSDGASATAQSLEINNALQKLDVSCNKISDNGATAIRKCLKINTTLAEFNVSRDYFTCKGVLAITEGIQTNKGLMSLTLCTGKMKASSYTCGHSFNMSVLKALHQNDKITELTLSMPFPLSHHTGLVNELEKINNKRRKHGIELVKLNYIDECD